MRSIAVFNLCFCISCYTFYYRSNKIKIDRRTTSLYYFGHKLHNFFLNRIRKGSLKPKRKRNIRKILVDKLKYFINPFVKFNKKDKEVKITQELLDKVNEKFGPNPICYLTGRKINISDASSYNLDHIIPRSRGGDNSIDNLGILTKQANMAKSEWTVEEHIQYCKEVLEHNGYIISKI